MAVYTPVIRLPPKRNPSISIPQNKKSSPTTSNEIKDCLVSDTLFLSQIPTNIREADLRTLLQHCLPIE